MITVQVRVPLQPGMSVRDVFVEAFRIYLQCTVLRAEEIVARRDFTFTRDLTDEERSKDELPVLLRLPEDLIEEQRERAQEDIDNLPQDLREFIFQGGAGPAELTPDLLDDYSLIIEMVRSMSDEEREAYLAQTSVDTTDPVAFARSLEEYRAHVDNRIAVRSDRERVQNEMFGVDEMTRNLRLRIEGIREELASSRGGSDDVRISDELYAQHADSRAELAELEAEYLRRLRALGFEDQAALQAQIDEFVDAYQREAILMANEELNRANHASLETRAIIEDDDRLEELFDALDDARDFASQAADTAPDRSLQSPADDRPGVGVDYSEEDPGAERYRLEQQAINAVRALKNDYPFLGYGPEEWALSIARASNKRQLARVLDGQIIELDESIERMRTELREDPDLIWKLDGLIQRMNAEAGIEPNTTLGDAIQQEVSDEETAELIQDVALAVTAVLAGLATAGTGLVPALAGGAAIVASAYDAWVQFRRYEEENAANNLNMYSRDPSIAWVVIALTGVGLDAAGVFALLDELPDVTRAIRRVAVGAEDGEDTVAALGEAMRLAKHEKLGNRERAAITRAAEERASQATEFAALRAEINGGALIALDSGKEQEIAAQIARSVYASMRRGVDGLDQWMGTREAQSLVGRLEDLAPDNLPPLRDAYQLARRRANQFHARAERLGLSEAEVADVLGDWARSPNTSPEQILERLERMAFEGRGRDPRATIPDPLAEENAARAHRGETARETPSAADDPAASGGDEAEEVFRGREARVPPPPEGPPQTVPYRDPNPNRPPAADAAEEVAPATRESTEASRRTTRPDGTAADDMEARRAEARRREEGDASPADDISEERSTNPDGVAGAGGGGAAARRRHLAERRAREVDPRTGDVRDPSARSTRIEPGRQRRDAYSPDDPQVFLERAHGLLERDSPVGAIANPGTTSLSEAMRLFYAAVENSPDREIGILRHRSTGTIILIQGSEGSVKHPTLDELIKRLGADHPAVQGDAWRPNNWEALVHSHPVEEGASATATSGRIPSGSDLRRARQDAELNGRLHSAYISVRNEDGSMQRIFYEYDPDSGTYTIAGRLPTEADDASAPENWGFNIFTFDNLEEYERVMYPRVGAEAVRD